VSWTAPITFVAGSVLTAAQLNAMQANLNALRSADIALTSTAFTFSESNVTLENVSGRYYQIGTLVIAMFSMGWPNPNSDANNIVLNGLPKTVANVVSAQAGGGGLAITPGYSVRAISNTTTAWVYGPLGRLQNQDLSGGVTLRGVLVYETP
jgi:hypothetical protein